VFLRPTLCAGQGDGLAAAGCLVVRKRARYLTSIDAPTGVKARQLRRGMALRHSEKQIMLAY
jgi:hypothetical protein